MDAEHPFTPEEKEVMDALVNAHNKFIKLIEKDLYPQQVLEDWLPSFHALQDILIVGATIRKYPNYFTQIL